MKTAFFAFLLWISIVLTCLAGWVTHVIVCIQQSSWLLLIGGGIVFPIGVIHGIGHWFGLFGGK